MSELNISSSPSGTVNSDAHSARAALDKLPVAVLGAGPVGLAAAAQLIERGIEAVVLEAGAQVGTNILEFGHVRLFSTWQYNIDKTMPKMLSETDWVAPHPKRLPFAREIVRHVLEPFSKLPQVAPLLMFGTKVTGISREGFDKVKSAGRDSAPFVINAIRNGVPVTIRAKAVIDATGTWTQPNPVGANGLPATGEEESKSQIFYGIPDVLGVHKERYVGKRTLVVGAGHSAANSLLALAELVRQEPTTRFAWSVRSNIPTGAFGGGSADSLQARGQLGTSLKRLFESGAMEVFAGLRITGIQRKDGALSIVGLNLENEEVVFDGFDEIICVTGQRPDLAMTRELRLNLDTWLESTAALGPLIDPNVHSCGTVRPHGHEELAHPEKGFYTLGVKSYGRAPTFLMTTGFEQARSVVAALAGDFAAANRVELELPETGVCSAGGSLPSFQQKSSCGVSPVQITIESAKASCC